MTDSRGVFFVSPIREYTSDVLIPLGMRIASARGIHLPSCRSGSNGFPFREPPAHRCRERGIVHRLRRGPHNSRYHLRFECKGPMDHSPRCRYKRSRGPDRIRKRRGTSQPPLQEEVHTDNGALCSDHRRDRRVRHRRPNNSLYLHRPRHIESH